MNQLTLIWGEIGMHQYQLNMIHIGGSMHIGGSFILVDRCILVDSQMSTLTIFSLLDWSGGSLTWKSRQFKIQTRPIGYLARTSVVSQNQGHFQRTGSTKTWSALSLNLHFGKGGIFSTRCMSWDFISTQQCMSWECICKQVAMFCKAGSCWFSSPLKCSVSKIFVENIETICWKYRKYLMRI